MMRGACIALLLLMATPALAQDAAGTVRIKDLGHFLGWRDNALIGYSIVTGLAGSGDSPRSVATRQSLSNVLSRLGLNVDAGDFQSRNVAAVMVTATLPPSANVGDKIDVTVTSIGDARSLVGGVLVMTPLLGPDRRSYALAQGALVVGGYNFRDEGNLSQKNYPTSGVVAEGATVETAVSANLLGADGRLVFVLKDADFTTAQRIADALNRSPGGGLASVRGADAVVITPPPDGGINRFVSAVEAVTIEPDRLARVVVNERSGTVVAGGDVKISSVVIAQGDIKVTVSLDDQALQPFYDGGYANGGRRSFAAATKLEVSDAANDAVVTFPNTTVADLVQALAHAKVGTRNMIAILQGIKAAGALHADILVQ